MLNSSAIKELVLNRKNSLLENIIWCLAINLACAFFQFDKYYSFMVILRPAASVMLVLIWLWCGFISGRDKKWGFLVFAGAYWVLPYVYIMCFEQMYDPREYNAFATILYKYADLLFDKPLSNVADFLNCGGYICVLSLMVLVCTTYFVGSNVADMFRKKEETDEDEELPFDGENN